MKMYSARMFGIYERTVARTVVVMPTELGPPFPLAFARDSMGNSRTTLPVRDPPPPPPPRKTQTLIDGFPFLMTIGSEPGSKDPKCDNVLE